MKENLTYNEFLELRQQLNEYISFFEENPDMSFQELVLFEDEVQNFSENFQAKMTLRLNEDFRLVNSEFDSQEKINELSNFCQLFLKFLLILHTTIINKKDYADD